MRECEDLWLDCWLWLLVVQHDENGGEKQWPGLGFLEVWTENWKCKAKSIQFLGSMIFFCVAMFDGCSWFHVMTSAVAKPGLVTLEVFLTGLVNVKKRKFLDHERIWSV